MSIAAYSTVTLGDVVHFFVGEWSLALLFALSAFGLLAVYGFLVMVWDALGLVRHLVAGRRRAAEAGEQPKVLEAAVILSDPGMALHIAGVWVACRRAIQDAVRHRVTPVPALKRVHCPYCWAALLYKFNTDTALSYVQTLEAQFPHGPAGDSATHPSLRAVWVHQGCPFNPTTARADVGASDFTFFAYLLTSYHAALKRGLAKHCPDSVGGGVGAVCEGNKGEAKFRFTNKDLDVVLQSRDDPEIRREKLMQQLERAELELCEVAHTGDADTSWADLMEMDDLEDEIAYLRRELDDQSGGQPEGVRDDYAALLAAEKFARRAGRLVLEKEEACGRLIKQHATESCELLKQRLLQGEKLARAVLTTSEAEDRDFMRCLQVVEKRAPKGRLEGSAPVVVCDDTQHRVVHGEQAFSDEIQRLKEQSLSMIQAHWDVAAKMDDLVAGSVGQRAPSKGLPGAVLEAEMAGSQKYDLPVHAGVVMSATHAPRGATLAPYGPDAHLVFITVRHAWSEALQRFVDQPYKVGDMVQVHTQHREIVEARVEAVYAPPGVDAHYCYTSALAGPIPKLKFGAPAVGRAMDIVSAPLTVAPTFRGAKGVCTNLSDSHAYYNLTTTAGDCGFPVYQHNGQLAGIHVLGGVIVGGVRRNACVRLLWPKLPKKHTEVLPPFDPVPLAELQGDVAGPDFHLPEKFRCVDKLKFKGLRTDKDVSGLMPEHFWMKPSTAMNHAEVRKYKDVPKGNLHPETFAAAVAAATVLDAECLPPFIMPDEAVLREALEAMDKARSAGPTADALTADQYILALGQGDKAQGEDILVARTLRLWRSILHAGPSCDFKHPEVDVALLRSCAYWNVIGKQDGYKHKKLPVADPPGTGRTIQAPSLELKLLWRATLGLNDDAWVHRPDGWVHAGMDDDLPCSASVVDGLGKALGVIAADLTAFDRAMTAQMISSFFRVYLMRAAPGMPKAFAAYLTAITAAGPLLMSDGAVYLRKHGNPSGFMNTLRLNCVVHLMCLCYAVLRRLGSVDPQDAVDFIQHDAKVQMCGDDSRFFALTPRAFEVFDMRNEAKGYLDVWASELPWEVKLEGLVVFSEHHNLEERALMCPPMVSRRFLLMQGILWEPLVNISRALKRLSCAERRTPELEQALVQSAATTLALQIFWQLQGWYFSPALHYFLREYGDELDLGPMYGRVASLYENLPRQLGGLCTPSAERALMARC